MKPFKHINAESIDEALGELARYKGKAVLNAGGTDLIGILKSEILSQYPDVVINLKTIPGMDMIQVVNNTCRIGASARLSDIAGSVMIREKFPALAAAAASVGSPELRNMATIGGNLCQDTRCWYYRYPDKMGGRIPCYRKGKGPCHAVKGENRYHAILGAKKCYAVCPSDTAIALGALDAQIKIVQPGLERLVSILDFFNPLGTTVLKPGELVTEVRIPVPKPNTTQVFLKNRLRESVDFAVVSVAIRMEKNGDLCNDARIILGAVAPVPYRSYLAEAAIKNRKPDESLAIKVADTALEGAKPLSQNRYKIEIAKTLVKRALLSL
ncbi:MAG: FAD binding domain-containing protein [Desulfobacula sp.]|jgi:xanthine dehydrogenase YagS FAD-binding subunit